MIHLGRETSKAPAGERGRRPLGRGPGLLLVLLFFLAGGCGEIATRMEESGPAPAASDRKEEVTALRPSLAIWEISMPQEPDGAAWMARTIARALENQLATGGSLRVASGKQVAEVRLGLGIAPRAPVQGEDLRLLRENLGVDWLLVGSYTLAADGRGLKIELEIRELEQGELLARVQERNSRGHLIPLVLQGAQGLRKAVGVPELSAEEQARVADSLPANREALELYSNGLQKLIELEVGPAIEDLEAAKRAEPGHAAPQAALAAAWFELAEDGQAQAAAEAAVERAGGLPFWMQQHLQAEAHERAGEWGRAVGIYQSFLARDPDDVEHGLHWARALIEGGRPGGALAVIETLEQLPPPAGSDPRIALTKAAAAYKPQKTAEQRELARAAATRGQELRNRLVVARARLLEAEALQEGRSEDLDRALVALTEAKSGFEAVGYRRGVAQSCELMAYTLSRQGRFHAARELFDTARKIHEELGNRRAVMDVLHEQRKILLQTGGEGLDELMSSAESVVAAYLQLGADFEAGAVLTEIGYNRFVEGDFAGAAGSYEQALEIFDRLGTKGAAADALVSIGEIHFQCGDLGAAEARYRSALALSTDAERIGYVRFRLGELYAARGEPGPARREISWALALQQETFAEAETRLALASLEILEGNLDEARQNARAARRVFLAAEAQDGVARSELVIARACLGASETREARDALDRAREQARGSPALRLEAVILEALIAVSLPADRRWDGLLHRLEAVASEAAEGCLIPLALEARLAMVEVALRAGKRGQAVSLLEQLAPEARRRGFEALARRAEAKR